MYRGHKADLDVKRSKVNLRLLLEKKKKKKKNLVELEFPMLYTKIQPQSFLGSGQEHFKAFLPYIGMTAIWFNGVEPFKQTVDTHSTEGLCGDNCSNGFTENI